MKKLTVCILALSLLLSGCSNWINGSYVSVTPHREKQTYTNQDLIGVNGYSQLQRVLEDMVEDGMESATISLESFDPALVARNMEAAISYVTNRNPIGAYAVESITYEEGTKGGQRAAAVNITYNYSRSEIRRIRRVEGMAQVADLVSDALTQCEAGLVVLVDSYTPTDFPQLIQDYAEQHPEAVMEVPAVTATLYPDSGSTRVLDLKFTYQTDRNALRNMQTRVQQVFASARYYVNSDGPDREKYTMLADFLTNLTKQYEYQFETSITPSYSLLCHGVGDSKAHAVAYGAMCRQVGLECLVVSGTKGGEPWFWNIIREGENYAHVDMIAYSQSEVFATYGDGEMEGYVWDYSAYPPCADPEPPEETTPPTQPREEETTPPPETTAPTEPPPTQPEPTEDTAPSEPEVTDPVPTETREAGPPEDGNP